MGLKKWKKMLGIASACACVLVTTVPVFAQTVDFNITVEYDSRPDPLSKRAAKADNEQNFYVRSTGFNGKGMVGAKSKLLNGGVYSNSAFMDNYDVGALKSSNYTSKAPAGKLYYMDTFYSAGTSKQLNVRGRYTP